MTQSLTLENISAHYGSTQVLEDLSLHIAEGELVSLLGSSGCGKTTTLRLVAGFLEPTAGTISLGDRDLTRLPAHARDIGLVFQTYALFPHLTVRDNVGFGLKQRKISSAERKRRVDTSKTKPGVAEFIVWAQDAFHDISEMTDTAFLHIKGKENKRKLTKAEITELERMKLDVLVQTDYMSDITPESMQVAFTSGQRVADEFLEDMQSRGIDVNSLSIDDYKKRVVSLFIEYATSE